MSTIGSENCNFGLETVGKLLWILSRLKSEFVKVDVIHIIPITIVINFGWSLSQNMS